MRKGGFILLIPIAKNEAILETYYTITTCISSMHLSLQLLGLNYSFKCVVEPRTPDFVRSLFFGSVGCV